MTARLALPWGLLMDVAVPRRALEAPLAPGALVTRWEVKPVEPGQLEEPAEGMEGIHCKFSSQDPHNRNHTCIRSHPTPFWYTMSHTDPILHSRPSCCYSTALVQQSDCRETQQDISSRWKPAPSSG